MHHTALKSDTRGTLAVLGAILGAFGVGIAWHFKGVGDAVGFLENLQLGADQASFTAAVHHARGMNVVALLNLLMAFIFFAFILLRLVEIVVGVAYGIAQLLALIPGLEEFWQPIASRLASMEIRIANKEPKVLNLIDKALKPVSLAIRATSSITPVVGTIAGMVKGPKVDGVKFVLPLGISLFPDVQVLTHAVPGLSAVIPPRMNLHDFTPSLPIEAAKREELCGQAAALIPRGVSYLTAKGNPTVSTVFYLTGFIIKSIAQYGPKFFCQPLRGSGADAKLSETEQTAIQSAKIQCAREQGEQPDQEDIEMTNIPSTAPQINTQIPSPELDLDFRPPRGPAPSRVPSAPTRPHSRRGRPPRRNTALLTPPSDPMPPGQSADPSLDPRLILAQSPRVRGALQARDAASNAAEELGEVAQWTPDGSFTHLGQKWDDRPNWLRGKNNKKDKYRLCMEDKRDEYNHRKANWKNPIGKDATPASATMWTPTSLFGIAPNALFFQVYALAWGDQRWEKYTGAKDLIPGSKSAPRTPPPFDGKDNAEQHEFGDRNLAVSVGEYYWQCYNLPWVFCSWDALYAPRWQARLRRAKEPDWTGLGLGRVSLPEMIEGLKNLASGKGFVENIPDLNALPGVSQSNGALWNDGGGRPL